MKHATFILLVGLCFFKPDIGIGQLSSFGKIPSEDSVILLLKTDKEDSNKVLHLVFLAKYLNNRNQDTSFQLASKALQLAEKLKWNLGMAYSHAAMAWSYYVHGNYAKALEENNITLKIGEKEHDQKTIGIALSNIGQIYYSRGDLNKAIEYNTRALKIDSALHDEWGIARNIGIIGSSYQALKKYPEAIDHYNSAYKLTKKIGNKNGSAVWLSNIGDVYNELHDYRMALIYYNQSAPIFKELKNTWSYAENLKSIGEVYIGLKRYHLSYEYLIEAIKLSNKIVAPENLQSCLLAMSKLYEVSTVSLPDTSEMHLLTLEKMRITSVVYLKKYMIVKDSLFSKEQQTKIMTLEINSKMDSLHIAQEKKDLITIQQIQKQKILRNSFITGSILLLLLIVVVINRNKLKRKMELERMRNRLSRDLHDDIGSTLSSINMLSRTAQSNLHLNDHDKTTTSLEKINERTTRLLDSMRDIIWNIQSGNDNLREVMSRMREYASTVLEAKLINYSFHFPDDTLDHELKMEIKNNLYLIFKEAVNNLSKYSGASFAEFTLRLEEKHIYLVIEDNGKGFDEHEIVHKGGLMNMRSRTAELKGRIDIHSIKGNGTRIEVMVPIQS